MQQEQSEAREMELRMEIENNRLGTNAQVLVEQLDNSP